MTNLLFRLDKHTKQISRFGNGKEAVKQFMADFGIKTRNTAKVNLFDLLMSPDMHYWQNTRIAWARTAEELAK